MEMHLGVDFDNTIVTYDHVFHKYARELGLISKEVNKNKQEIRDTIRMLPDGNNRWTELQGLVYGCHMDEAEPTEGVEDFLKICKEKGVKVSIISHKTKYPALGPRVDLRQAARQWLKDRGFLSGLGLSAADVAFVKTLDEKLTQIEQRKCTHFIDDLIEVLLCPNFPKGVQRIFYVSGRKDNIPPEIGQFKTWNEIKNYFFG